MYWIGPPHPSQPTGAQINQRMIGSSSGCAYVRLQKRCRHTKTEGQGRRTDAKGTTDGGEGVKARVTASQLNPNKRAFEPSMKEGLGPMRLAKAWCGCHIKIAGQRRAMPAYQQCGVATPKQKPPCRPDGSCPLRTLDLLWPPPSTKSLC